MNIPFTFILTVGLCLGYIILLVVVARNSHQLVGIQRWLLATLFVALLAQAVQLLPLFNSAPGASTQPTGNHPTVY